MHGTASAGDRQVVPGTEFPGTHGGRRAFARCAF